MSQPVLHRRFRSTAALTGRTGGACAAAAILAAACAAPVGATQTMVVLSPVGPTYTLMQLNGISGDGRYVLGQMGNVATFRATRWNADGSGITDLGLLPGRPYSEGTALSYDGWVASGNGYNAAYNPQAFQWTGPSQRVALPTPPGSTFGYTGGISSDGSVIAGWTNVGNTQRLWRWTALTGTTLVPLPGGSSSSHFDLQNTRLISGNGRYLGCENYRYDLTTGAVMSIGFMADASTSPNPPSITSISSDGTVATGYQPSFLYPDGEYSNHAGFVWVAGVGFENIGSLTSTRDCLPRFISGDGSTVLGICGNRLFIWSHSEGLRDFDAVLAAGGVDTHGMTNLEFNGISDDGRTIAGMGTDAAGNDRGWVLTVPIPCRADFDGSGILNPDDLADFITAYFDTTDPRYPRCDFDQNGRIDPDDLSSYINAYFNGC